MAYVRTPPTAKKAAESFRAALAQAQADLENAIKERDLWNVKIAQTQNLIRSLAVQAMQHEKAANVEEAVRNAVHSELGMTEAVRTIMRSSQSPMHSHQIRDSLVLLGYDLQRYANHMAVIHRILKRLEAANEIVPVRGGFIWRRGLPPPPNKAFYGE